MSTDTADADSHDDYSEHVSVYLCLYFHVQQISSLSIFQAGHALDVDSAISTGRDYPSGQACTPSESRLHKTPLLLHLPVSPSRASPIQVLIPSLRCMQVSSQSKFGRSNWACSVCHVISGASGVDPVPSQGLHPHPSHCLGPQHHGHAPCSTPGPTRSSAPDSRDLTLHLYLRLTCRACPQATFSPTDARPTVPTLEAQMPLIGVVEPQRPTWSCVGTQYRGISLLIRDHSWFFAPKWSAFSSTRSL